MSVALTLATLACNDSGAQPTELSDSTTASSSPPASTSAAPSQSADSEEEAIIAAYKGFFTALTDAEDLSESAVRASLSPYGTGAAVDGLVEVASLLTEKGQHPDGEVVFASLTVELTSDSSAIVKECRDTSTETIISATDGSIVSTGVPGTKFEATMANEASAWKVATYVAVEGAC